MEEIFYQKKKKRKGVDRSWHNEMLSFPRGKQGGFCLTVKKKKKNERIVKMHGVHVGGYNNSNSGSKQSGYYSRSSTLPPSALLVRILPATFPPVLFCTGEKSAHVARFRKAPIFPWFFNFNAFTLAGIMRNIYNFKRTPHPF